MPVIRCDVTKASDNPRCRQEIRVSHFPLLARKTAIQTGTTRKRPPLDAQKIESREVED